MSLFKKSIKKVVSGFISIFPTKKDVWVFGAWRGNLYSDNTKYLFEYVNRFNPEIKAVWITKNKDLLKQLKQKGYKAYYYLSPNGIKSVALAAAAFETEGNHDISPFMNIRTKVFMLWHGLGVKDIKWKDEKGNLPTELSYSDYKKHIWFSTSDYFTEILSKQFYASPKNFHITGFARNDSFILKPQNKEVEEIIKQKEYDKTIIYMPTHRNFGKDGNEQINLQTLTKLNEMLVEKNWLMVFKPHFHEIQNIMQFGGEYSNIVMATDSEIWGDPYSYLHYFDALVSDYSSVASDFLCSGKPVVLFPYDIDNYKKNDGGLLPIFYELPTGPSCYSWEEVISTLGELFVNDTWVERREKCRLYYHYYNDGKNCQRNYEMAVKILEARSDK